MVGDALRVKLEAAGHTCLILSRNRKGKEQHVFWDPENGVIDAEQFIEVDAVVNLAGSTIARRWSDRVKLDIFQSRLNATTLLCRTLASLRSKPKVLVSASAVGYYGSKTHGLVSEDDPPGSGFLADLCQKWEQATASAARAGIRTVVLRIGVVLAMHSGMLHRMLPAFKLGAGAILGNGRQCVSWIALEDLVDLILYCLQNETIQGPLNAVAPEVVTNAQLSRSLGRVLQRPVFLRVPRQLLKIASGVMADELLLADVSCSARKALEVGYSFHCPDLDTALLQLLRPLNP